MMKTQIDQLNLSLQFLKQDQQSYKERTGAEIERFKKQALDSKDRLKKETHQKESFERKLEAMEKQKDYFNDMYNENEKKLREMAVGDIERAKELETL